MKKRWIILIIIFILIRLCIYRDVVEDKRKLEAKKTYVKNILKEYNLTIDEEYYDIKKVNYTKGNLIKSSPIFGIMDKRISYRSEYFKGMAGYQELEYRDSSIISGKIFFTYEGLNIIRIVVSQGLRPYVLNELIYDKTKGNDFVEIEKIFQEYKNKGIGIYSAADWISDRSVWVCKNRIPENSPFNYGINFVMNPDCIIKDKNGDETRNYEVIEKYEEKYKEYFSIPRKLESIDWSEYMKIHEIYPVLAFKVKDEKSYEEIMKITDETEKKNKEREFYERIENLRKEIQEKIEPYFNKEELYVHVF